MFTSLAKELGFSTLILVNRETLMDQTVAAIQRVWPEADVGCVQVSMFLLGYQVYVASMCTGEHVSARIPGICR